MYQAVILAGGLGQRISEESVTKPKPMVTIGNMPILWHILKIYSAYGVKDFIICLGYKGHIIKEYFVNYYLHNSNVKVSTKDNKIQLLSQNSEDWEITLVDTGEHTQTGGRLKRIKPFLNPDKSFFMTYGDGVSNVDLNALRDFHEKSNRLATLTAVLPQGRFGALELDESKQMVSHFKEKPEGDKAWINGGFFALSPKVIDYIQDDATVWEKEPLETLAAQGQLGSYLHSGFWSPMDTMRDQKQLEELWQSGDAAWKVW